MKTTTVVPGPKRMPKGQNPDGRTKKAYAKQYRREKWPCWKCDAKRAAAKREGVKKDDLPAEMSFVSKEALEHHLLGHTEPRVGEQKTRNRLRREP